MSRKQGGFLFVGKSESQETPPFVGMIASIGQVVLIFAE